MFVANASVGDKHSDKSAFHQYQVEGFSLGLKDARDDIKEKTAVVDQLEENKSGKHSPMSKSPHNKTYLENKL